MAMFARHSNYVAIAAQLTRLERKLDLVIAHLGLDLPDDGMDDIRELIAAGRKIEAIKVYRERTGLGLAEAKQAVDRGL
ncbi:MAG TPA: ribosomal protein L7/L12 [Phycisphaerales bacterium]|nr:ribosomal protein L7/L12 [Phycisphaerales bacterium]